MLASRLAGPNKAVPSLPDSEWWLRKTKQKNSVACSCVPTLHVLVESSYVLDVVLTFWIWIVNKQSMSDRLVMCLCLTVSPVQSTHDHCMGQASGTTCDNDVMEKAIKALARRRPTAR